MKAMDAPDVTFTRELDPGSIALAAWIAAPSDATRWRSE